MVRVCEWGRREEKWSGYVKGVGGRRNGPVCEGDMREEKWSGYVKGV